MPTILQCIIFKIWKKKAEWHNRIIHKMQIPSSEINSCLMINHRNFLMSKPSANIKKRHFVKTFVNQSSFHPNHILALLTRSGGGLVGLARSWTGRGAWSRSYFAKLDVGSKPATFISFQENIKMKVCEMCFDISQIDEGTRVQPLLTLGVKRK